MTLLPPPEISTPSPAPVNPVIINPRTVQFPIVIVRPFAPDPALAPAMRTSTVPLNTLAEVFTAAPGWV